MREPRRSLGCNWVALPHAAACVAALLACASGGDVDPGSPSSFMTEPGPVTAPPSGGTGSAPNSDWFDQWANGQAGMTGGAPAGAGGVGPSTGGSESPVLDAGMAPSPPPSEAPTTYTITLGPVALSPGMETVVCVTVRLGNEQEVYLPHIRGELRHGSHHLIAYRSVEAAESPTPTPCRSFAGVFDSNGQEGPLMIVEKPQDALLFPPGVALRLAARQMLMLELHAINTTNADLEASGTFYFDTLPISAQIIESNMAFWGTLAIAIAPQSQGTTGVLFQPGNAGTKAFALTTHQHRLGTRFRVWASAQPGDTSSPPIAETVDWSQPPLYRLDPELSFDGFNGLSFQCDWDNTTDSFITFGESALQEMCFLWMYYYPSSGFDARFF